MTDAPLTFDPALHRYYLGGRRIPGITAILKAAGIIDDEWYTEEGRRRGTAVHMALQFAAEGDLDLATVDRRLHGYLEAHRRFVAEKGFVAKYPPELLVCSRTLSYATMIDAVGTVGAEQGFWCINWKTGQPARAWAVQSAGEAIAFSETAGAVPLFTIRRASVRLSADGTYKFIPHEDRHDINVFKAARVIAAWHGDPEEKEEKKEEAAS